MNRNPKCHVLALVVALLCGAVPASTLACGEGMFNAGRGLPYQSYLAPRPATVLIFAAEPDTSRQRVYRGLEQAGHRITVVADQEALIEALSKQRYDVVIAALEEVDAVSATSNPPAVLPVVQRGERNSPRVRERFNLVLVDGASLGQYLRAINSLVHGGDNG